MENKQTITSLAITIWTAICKSRYITRYFPGGPAFADSRCHVVLAGLSWQTWKEYMRQGKPAHMGDSGLTLTGHGKPMFPQFFLEWGSYSRPQRWRLRAGPLSAYQSVPTIYFLWFVRYCRLYGTTKFCLNIGLNYHTVVFGTGQNLVSQKTSIGAKY